MAERADIYDEVGLSLTYYESGLIEVERDHRLLNWVSEGNLHRDYTDGGSCGLLHRHEYMSAVLLLV